MFGGQTFVFDLLQIFQADWLNSANNDSFINTAACLDGADVGLSPLVSCMQREKRGRSKWRKKKSEGHAERYRGAAEPLQRDWEEGRRPEKVKQKSLSM